MLNQKNGNTFEKRDEKTQKKGILSILIREILSKRDLNDRVKGRISNFKYLNIPSIWIASNQKPFRGMIPLNPGWLCSCLVFNYTREKHLAPISLLDRFLRALQSE